MGDHGHLRGQDEPPATGCFDYSFIFPDIFFIFLILFYFLFFDIVLLLFSFFLFFLYAPGSLWDLGHQARGHARAPVVGAASQNRWTNRGPQPPRNISRSEASQRSSSQHQDLALSNCLQTPVLDVSGQTTSKTGIQPHPSKKKNDKKVCYRCRSKVKTHQTKQMKRK